MFSFSTMILECCCCCFASIFVASFVETIDALALPLFTHSFLFLSENALVVEKLVFVRVIECIFTAHKVRASNNNDSTRPTRRDQLKREVWCLLFWIFCFWNQNFSLLFSRRFFFSRQTLLSFSLLHIKIFPFAFVSHSLVFGCKNNFFWLSLLSSRSLLSRVLL